MTTRLSFSPHEITAEQCLGPFALSVDEDGGVVERAKFNFGYQCRNIEKVFERINFAQGISYCDRIDYLAAPFCNFVYAQAVEQLGAMSLPPKADYGRVVLLELSRIYSHLYCVGNIARTAGHEPIFNFSIREREKISNLFEMFCGSRLGFGAICIGGIAADITDGWLFQVERVLREILAFLIEVDEYLLLNPLFLGRLTNLMVLKRDIAESCGVTGPNLRACGSSVDLRRSHPVAAYGALEITETKGFESGDALSRFLIRLAEIKQSEAIIRAAIVRIPAGNFRILTGPNIFLPSGMAVAKVEGPRGELGVFLVSGGENRPLRAKYFTPSCAVAELLPALSSGACLDDLFLGLQSLDLSISEIDR